jgi:hypothetical protein
LRQDHFRRFAKPLPEYQRLKDRGLNVKILTHRFGRGPLFANDK